MAVGKNVIQGTSVSKNPIPLSKSNSVIKLKGEFNGKPAEFGLGEDVISKHMMLVGGTGCGKSTLFYHIIEQIKRKMTADDVMIIFDSKGDFYSKFYSKKDCVIGNSSQYINQSEKWNIFKEILADGWDDRQVMLNTQEICKALFSDRTKGNNNNPFFPNAARDLLAAIIIASIRLGVDDKSFVSETFYNNKIKEFLDSSSGQDLCDYLDGFDDMRSVLSYIEGDSAQSQGVLAEMYSVIRDVFIGVFAEKGKFSMRNFVRRKGGRTLFIEYDLSIGSVLTPMYKMLFDLALKEALGRTKSQGNVYLICDEFKLLPNLEHIDDGVNFGRSLGVKVFAGLQSIEQLFEIYGQSRGKNLAAGFSSIIAFRANDVTTREYISNLHGKNMVLEQYRMMNNTMVEEKRIGSTVEDWDLNSLRVGEAIVGLPFAPPFRFYFEMYRK
ncbi:MAG: type IV secretion system DNA-binding domain-containing protein [Ruminococcus sp.]|nr:type IV secretion system DNA-binding domain-containing protein [Ruminococcus sp.]